MEHKSENGYVLANTIALAGKVLNLTQLLEKCARNGDDESVQCVKGMILSHTKKMIGNLSDLLIDSDKD